MHAEKPSDLLVLAFAQAFLALEPHLESHPTHYDLVHN